MSYALSSAGQLRSMVEDRATELGVKLTPRMLGECAQRANVRGMDWSATLQSEWDLILRSPEPVHVPTLEERLTAVEARLAKIEKSSP